MRTERVVRYLAGRAVMHARSDSGRLVWLPAQAEEEPLSRKRPKPIVATAAAASANRSTGRSSLISVSQGTPCRGMSPARATIPAYAIRHPAASPPHASTALSTSNCRTMRPRLAPMAARMRHFALADRRARQRHLGDVAGGDQVEGITAIIKAAGRPARGGGRTTTEAGRSGGGK